MENQNQTANNKNTGCGIFVIVLIVILLIAAVFGGNDSSASKYSNDYNNNKSYRDNVNAVADAYGKDAYEVDRAIQAVADEMNN